MKLVVGHLYPEYLNIYADRGNIAVLERRTAWRGIELDYRTIGLGDEVRPGEHDLYYVGGGQDHEQALIAPDLAAKGPALVEAVDAGAAFLAVCGGYQLLGRFYRDRSGAELPGIGLLPHHTVAGERRMIGDVLLESELDPGVPQTLAGFENHAGRTYLDDGAEPLGRVISGFGNNGKDGFEGCRVAGAVGTYLHGPLLPRNPWLADWIIARALARRNGIPPSSRRSPTSSRPARRPSRPSAREAAADASRPSMPSPPSRGRLGRAVGAVVTAVAPASVPRAVDEDAATGRRSAEPEPIPALSLDDAEEGNRRLPRELGGERPLALPVAEFPVTVSALQLGDCARLARDCVQFENGRLVVLRLEDQAEPVTHATKRSEIGLLRPPRLLVEPELPQDQPQQLDVVEVLGRVVQDVPGIGQGDRQGNRISFARKDHWTFLRNQSNFVSPVASFTTDDSRPPRTRPSARRAGGGDSEVSAGAPLRRTGLWRDAFIRFTRNRAALVATAIFGVILLYCVIVPFVSPYDPNAVNFKDAYLPASLEHPFGTDKFGRDLFTRVAVGGRISIAIGSPGPSQSSRSESSTARSQVSSGGPWTTC